MSTKTTLKTSMKDAKSIGLGAAQFLAEILKLQEPGIASNISVTYDPKAKTVRMHGSERTTVNAGVISFSDSPYDIGLQSDEDGSVSVVYDSYVHSGKLTKRVNGPSKVERANLKQCQGLYNLTKAAQKTGKKVSTYAVEGRLRAFVPA